MKYCTKLIISLKFILCINVILTFFPIFWLVLVINTYHVQPLESEGKSSLFVSFSMHCIVLVDITITCSLAGVGIPKHCGKCHLDIIAGVIESGTGSMRWR